MSGYLTALIPLYFWWEQSDDFNFFYYSFDYYMYTSLLDNYPISSTVKSGQSVAGE